MIPKIIHYCWLSNDPLPETLQKCVNSWKKYLPDYEIKLWNFDVFEKGKSKWVDQAFEAKKYAFAADYIRSYALYHEGGIYLDSDVEVLKSFNDLLDLPYFIGMDSADHIEAAVVGTTPGWWIYKELLNYYDSRDFNQNGKFNMKTLPILMEEFINQKGGIKIYKNINDLKNDQSSNKYFIKLLNFTFFSPKSYISGKILKNQDSYSIHHFQGSWYPAWKQNIKKIVIKIGGYRLKNFIKKYTPKKLLEQK